MIKITGGRSSSKSYKAMKYASENNLYIVVNTNKQARDLFLFSKECDLPIKYPVTVSELRSGEVGNTSLERDGIVVDNALAVLQELIPVKVNMMTIEVEDKNNE